eukprot:9315592-Pyramimonas_sp.AAC.1
MRMTSSDVYRPVLRQLLPFEILDMGGGVDVVQIKHQSAKLSRGSTSARRQAPCIQTPFPDVLPPMYPHW